MWTADVEDWTAVRLLHCETLQFLQIRGQMVLLRTHLGRWNRVGGHEVTLHKYIGRHLLLYIITYDNTNYSKLLVYCLVAVACCR